VILPAICYAGVVSWTLAELAAARTGYLDKLFPVTVVRLLHGPISEARCSKRVTGEAYRTAQLVDPHVRRAGWRRSSGQLSASINFLKVFWFQDPYFPRALERNKPSMLQTRKRTADGLRRNCEIVGYLVAGDLEHDLLLAVVALVLPARDQADKEGDDLFGRALLAKDLDLSLGARNRCEGHFANCSSNFGIGVRNYLRATSRIAGENRVVYDRLDHMLTSLVRAKADEVSGKEQVHNPAGAIGAQGPFLGCARQNAAPAIGKRPLVRDYLPAVVADLDRNAVKDRER
jgi:hypothetical protein